MFKKKLTLKYSKGRYVNIREVKIEDSEFILSLRCDEKKSKFLHKTEYNLEKQKKYLKHYMSLDNEYYFIITDKQNIPLGTIRMYDLKKDTFISGSWIMTKKSAVEEVLEGNYLMLNFAYSILKYQKFHFDVRKENKKVIRFHKMMGAKIVEENDIDYFFEASLPIYLSNMRKMID